MSTPNAEDKALARELFEADDDWVPYMTEDQAAERIADYRIKIEARCALESTTVENRRSL